jgi:hypothetical protein
MLESDGSDLKYLAQQHYAPFSAAKLIFGGQASAAENKVLFSAADASPRK